MKEKLIKAYWTAWRWPEVYSESKDVIWTTRALAVAIPVFLVVLTFLTGVTLFGAGFSLIIAAFVALALILLTIANFYDEYPTVEDFEAREARIREFFLGFPSITDIPVIENNENEWIAYGHIEKPVFLDAIARVLFRVTEDAPLADSYLGIEDQVEHLYACFRDPREGHWSEGLDLCPELTEYCFPITRIEKNAPDASDN
jgi:preprotein translocase subunit SecE